MKRKEKRHISITAKLQDVRNGSMVWIHIPLHTSKEMNQFTMYEIVVKFLKKCNDRKNFSIIYLGFAEQ